MLPLAKVRSHEVHALVDSLAFRGSVDIDDLLSASLWDSLSIFTNSYLRDIALHTEGLHRLETMLLLIATSCSKF